MYIAQGNRVSRSLVARHRLHAGKLAMTEEAGAITRSVVGRSTETVLYAVFRDATNWFFYATKLARRAGGLPRTLGVRQRKDAEPVRMHKAAFAFDATSSCRDRSESRGVGAGS